MTVQQWSQPLHELAGHDGPAEGCSRCVLLRMECQGRIRYETASEADDLVRELHERRRLAPQVRVYDCRWCGYFHIVPTIYRPVGPPAGHGRWWRLRRGGRVWRMWRQ